MEYAYHICGKGFVGCPGDASDFARRLEQLWAALPVSGAKPTLYHWHKDYDPYGGTAAVGGQYQVERTANPSVDPVFILFAQTIGTPVRPPPEGWGELRGWLDGNGWGFIALLGEERYRDANVLPDGTIPLSGTMFELFDALSTGEDTHLIVYDLSRLTQPPSPDTPEHQRQRAWRQRLIAELGKTYTVRAPETPEEFDQRVLKDLKAAFELPALDPRHGALPSLAAVGVDEPLLFGRDELIETLSRRIMVQGAAFTRVWGVSGAGKSSLLRAGLMGSWFDRSRGQAGLLANATALLIEPFQLGALDADPLKALGLLLTGAFAHRDTGAVGPSPSSITAALVDLPPPSGDRVADLRLTCAWWDELAAALDGPFVLILDQAEQIDAQAKREARDRVDRDSKADPTPLLSPVWGRFVDLITSLAGVANPALDAPALPNGPPRFRLVLGLHRESAIDLWVCDKAGLLANPSIEVPPLTDWRMVIQNTIAMYGLTLDEPLLTKMTAEADQLTNERQPVRTDDQIADDTRYDRASVLPLVKVALWRLIATWRQQNDQSDTAEFREADKTLDLSKFAPVSGIADSVDELGEAAIGLWVRTLSEGRQVQGLFEQEALTRECADRFDHLFMGLIDVGEKGRAELNYIRRDGELARDEQLLVSALRATELLKAPDAEHWRLSHRTVIANWRGGRLFITGQEARLATKRRLMLAYQSGDTAFEWREQDIGPFVDLAFGWIGNDEAEDAELRDYLRSGLTIRFKPERFALDAEDPLDRLPWRVLTTGQYGWAERLFECAMKDQSRDSKGGVWTLIAAAFGRQDWLEGIFAQVPPQMLGQVANYVDPGSGTFPLLQAALDGQADCVRLLLDRGGEPNRCNDHDGMFPLLLAARNGHADCVGLLLEGGATAKQIDPNSGTFPLLIAAQGGHAGCVRLLLDRNTDPNQVNERTGTFPLLSAAQPGHAECVRLLLENGAEPNRINDKDCTFPLLFASQNGYSDCVRLLLDNGAEPNQVRGTDGASPLFQAVQQGHAECVRLLLDKGADPNRFNNEKGIFTLGMATRRGHADCVRLLLEKDASPNSVDERDLTFPLLWAALNGYVDCASLLLDNGADPNQMLGTDEMSPLRAAAQGGHADCVRLLLERGAEPNKVNANDGMSPLLTAAEQGHAECVRLLLDKGAEPNRIHDKNGIFPLLQAAQLGRAECVRLLLDGGAELNLINERNGTYPLRQAAYYGHAECVRLLLNRGADPNQIGDPDGAFPLLAAAQNGYADCVSVLLDRGAEPNRVNDRDGAFPLLWAAGHGHTDCVRLLLDKGADPNGVNEKNGTFPLLVAAQNGHADCVRLLLDHGADLSHCHRLTGMTPLQVALRNRHWVIVRMLGNEEGMLQTVSPEFQEAIKTLLSLPPEDLAALERNAIDAPRHRSSVRQVEIKLPVYPGVSDPGSNENVAIIALDAVNGMSATFGDSRDSIEVIRERAVAWSLNHLNDAVVLIGLRMKDRKLETECLIFDLPASQRRIVCAPGFDFDGLARSLNFAGRPLDLREPSQALCWASLVVIYRFGGTPVLPDNPWPLVPDMPVPDIPYPENYWRGWNFHRGASGPTVTLPFVRGEQLLRGRIAVPENGIGVGLTGDPEVIASGFNLPIPRFVSVQEDGPPTGLWLVREIEHD